MTDENLPAATLASLSALRARIAAWRWVTTSRVNLVRLADAVAVDDDGGESVSLVRRQRWLISITAVGGHTTLAVAVTRSTPDDALSAASAVLVECAP